MRAAALTVAALLVGSIASAQEGAMVADATVADAWMSGLPDPASPSATAAPARVAARARIVGSFRPVEPNNAAMPRPAGVQPTGQTGVDLYLDFSNAPGPRPGESFHVYRKINAPTLRRSEVTIQVGVVTVVSIDGPLGVARVVGGPEPSSLPFLRSGGVLVGDFIRTDEPLGQEAPVAKPARRPRAMAPAAPTADVAATEEPSAPEPAVDDGFESWGADTAPIDF